MNRGKILVVTLLVLTVSFLAFTSITFADKKGEEKSESGKAMETPIESLKYKNIMGDIGADYHYLSDIGEMIDMGRAHNDGNTLIAAALLLLYAENDSGKKSSVITGADLLKEAAELAKVQENAKLATKLADVYEDGTFGLGDKTMAADLRKKAKEYDAASSQRSGYGIVIINNETPFYVQIYIDGYDQGVLYSGNYTYVTDVPAGTVLLYAYAPYTDWEWGPTTGYLSAGGTYTWNLIFE